MSDRFYTQMADHYNMSVTELNRAFWFEDSPERIKLEAKAEGKQVNKSTGKKKITRLDLNKQLTELLGVDIQAAKLPLATLEAFVNAVKKKSYKKVEVPEGRLKAPYQTAIIESLGCKVDLDNATVKTMKLFLEEINK